MTAQQPRSHDHSHLSTTGPLRIVVLVASVREQRVGRAVADWAVHHLDPDDVDVVDLAEVELPPDSALRPGGSGATAVSARLAAADGYLVVTPEHNHSYPASVKRLIDWHYREWMFKPAAVISYGAHGGALATEHLRGVFAELHVVTTRRTLALRAPWDHLDDGAYTAGPGTEHALRRVVEELRWWADVLRSARLERALPR